jgi:hypothetical protein
MSVSDGMLELGYGIQTRAVNVMAVRVSAACRFMIWEPKMDDGGSMRLSGSGIWRCAELAVVWGMRPMAQVTSENDRAITAMSWDKSQMGVAVSLMRMRMKRLAAAALEVKVNWMEMSWWRNWELRVLEKSNPASGSAMVKT